MKNIFTILAAIGLLQSCALGDKQETSTTDSTAVYRDTTITPANAYSDLFLDSSAISSFIQQEKLDEAAAQKLRNFYTVRNNEFAWFHSQGLTEEGRSFWALSSNGGDSTSKDGDAQKNRRQQQDSDSLLQKDSMLVSSTDTGDIHKELVLTHRFIQYAETNKGSITAANMYYVVPRKKMDALELADSIVNKQKDSALASNKTYAAMKQQLGTYYNAAKNGGWQPIASASGLKKGTKSPAVTALKKRLQATNDYAATDTTNMFSDSLATAVKDVQQRHGLAATGVVNDSLVAVLNVPAVERVQQLLLNMNRMMWMPYASEQNRIEVNLPSQMLYAYEGNNKVIEMPVIVGKEGTSTLAFSGKINQVVFNPTWNVPESIVKNEIMPKMKNDPAYLKKNNMEVVSNGNDSVPVIRQLPGKDNPLGKVKFLFPNSFDIYLHDTPNKSLFKKQDRALSHGCIRVADAAKLAEYLLKDQGEWTPEKIRTAMNNDKEQTVAVKNAEPVQINYFSAWVDAGGKLNFRNDVNGRDRATYARLFTNASPTQDVAKAAGDSSNTKDKAATGRTTRR
jgi:L,D-transpeptidase YcbB